ncbi:MAG: protein kinase [Chloroflexi bacterium]|nr:protein kinase [Chloroflexota bacterium]MCI0577768.1 protein kinase [Chloroflexota bacterium]MCI0725915.1 protein kinase [Chloroflexota bacterium]
MNSIQPGQMLGPYRVIEQVGEGGMATVFKAYHAAVDRTVALKILPRQLAQDPEFTGRFRQEARTIANLEHPHILPVYDYGESDGYTYLVMRYLDAGTLRARIASAARTGGLPLAQVDHFFSQLADALDYAHGRGVVHRDVKPANVLIDARGSTFLTDFGIARLVESTSSFTGTGALIGTPSYMSPEQGQGVRVDHRSDIYSLGVILYEMITGRVPFQAETPAAVIFKHVYEALPLPSSLKPGLNPRLEQVILKALAKNPADRFATAAEFLAAWKETLSAPAVSTVHPPAPIVAALDLDPTNVQPAAAAPPAVADSGRQPLSSTTDRPSANLATQLASAPTPEPLPTVVESERVAQRPQPSGDPATQVTPTPRAGRRPARAILLIGGIVAGLASLLILAAVVIFAINLFRPQTDIPTRASDSEPAGPGDAEFAPILLGRELPPATPDDLQWTSWGAANLVKAIAIHGDEMVAGAQGSLSIWDRRDGSLLHLFTINDGLPGPEITALWVDDDGTIWAGADAGVGRYDPERQEWQTYTEADGLGSQTIRALLRRRDGTLLAGSIYGGAGSGLNLFDGETWSVFPGFPSGVSDPDRQLDTNVRALVEDDDGVLWVGTDNGLGRYDGENWTRFSTEDGLPSNEITTLYASDDGMLGVGTTAGVAGFDGEAFEVAEELAGNSIFGLLQDSQGHYWVAGREPGLSRFDPGSEEWEFFPDTSYWYSPVEDEDGNLYFGANGVARYDGQAFTNWLVPNVPLQGGYQRILAAPDGALWFGEYALSTDIFNPETGQWTPFEGLPCCPVPLAFDTQGRLWAGDSGLVWIVDGDQQMRITADDGLPAEAFVWDVDFFTDGGASIATEAGWAIWDGQRISILRTPADGSGMPSERVYTVLVTADQISWLGMDLGLSRLDRDHNWTHYTIGNPFGETMERITDIAEDAGGAIWVTTSGDGIYRFDGDQIDHFERDNPAVELLSNHVTGVTIAPDGTLWFGFSYDGAGHFDGQNWTFYRWEDGLIINDVRDIFVDDSGAVWFATSGGVTRYRP